MKLSYLLSCSVLVGLMTMVGGAVVGADNTAPVSTAQSSLQAETELLAQLSSQPTFSDSTLRRPL